MQITWKGIKVKPIKFKGANCTYAEHQPEYLPLPVHKANDEECTVTSCWKLTFWERLIVLFTGKFWFQQLTFDDPLQPQCPSVRRPI